MKNGSHRIQHADAAASDGRIDSRLDTRAIGRLEQFFDFATVAAAADRRRPRLGPAASLNAVTK